MITEKRDKQSRITSTTTDNAATNESKTQEKINVENLEDLSEQKFKFDEDLISQMTNKLVAITDTLGKSFDKTYRDTNAINKRISNLEAQARATAKEILTTLRTTDSTGKFPDFNEAKYDLATGRERDKILTKDELIALNTHADGKLMSPEEIYQRNIATKLIKSQLDSVFGTDTTSFESTFQLSDADQKDMIDTITKKYPELFNGKDAQGNSIPDTQRLQMIANITDSVMNKLSGGDAIFDTNISSDGTYTTSITNSIGAKTTLKVNNKGQTTEQTFTIPADATDSQSKPIIFTTVTTYPDIATTLKTGSFGTTVTIMDDGVNTPVKLNSYEDSLTNMAYAQLKAVEVGKFAVRGTLFMGKQAIINVATAPISITHSFTAAILTPIVIKGSAQALGYKFSRPTALSGINKMIGLTCGNRRALVSATGVFTKGTIGSKIIQSVKTGDITKSFQEQRDLHEEYLAWDDDIVTAILNVRKIIFPETLGNQLVSNASLKSETGTSDINNKQKAMNALGITPGSNSIAASIVSLAPTLARR